MTIELTRDQYESLLYVIGYAATAASLKKDEEMFRRAFCMANAIGPADPRFVPYIFESEEEEKP